MISKFSIRNLSCLTVIFLLIVFLGSAQAQMSHSLPSSSPQLLVEFMKPNLSNGYGVKSLSSVWFFNANWPMGDGRIVFLSEYPIAYFDREDSPFGSFDTQLMIGNILAGIEFRGEQGLLGGFGKLSVRFPTAIDDKLSAASYGFISDFDRYEAFIPNIFSIIGGGGWRLGVFESATASSQFHIGINGLYIISTKGGGGSEFFAKYYGQFWYLSQYVAFGFGLSGIMYLSEGDLNIGERVEHQLTFNIQYIANSIKPGAFIRVPLGDDLKQSIDFVAGFNVAVDLE